MLGESVLRQDRLTGGGAGRAPLIPPLPVNLDASVALHRLEDAVRAFTDAPSTYSLPVCARMAVLYLPSLLGFTQIVPLVNEVHAAVGAGRRLVDRPGPKVYTGPCGAVVDDVECFEELWAGEGDVQIHCRVCGTTWNIQDRRDTALAAIGDQVTTAEHLSRALTNLDVHITRHDIRNWWGKGLITRCLDEHGRSFYRVGQVLTAWETMQGQGRGRRKTANIS